MRHIHPNELVPDQRLPVNPEPDPNPEYVPSAYALAMLQSLDFADRISGTSTVERRSMEQESRIANLHAQSDAHRERRRRDPYGVLT